MGAHTNSEVMSKLRVLYMQERDHFVVVDMAYQGFATGDLDNDAAGLRQLAADGHNLLLCQSFSKNLGLYGIGVVMLTALWFLCRALHTSDVTYK